MLCLGFLLGAGTLVCSIHCSAQREWCLAHSTCSISVSCSCYSRFVPKQTKRKEHIPVTQRKGKTTVQPHTTPRPLFSLAPKPSYLTVMLPAQCGVPGAQLRPPPAETDLLVGANPHQPSAFSWSKSACLPTKDRSLLGPDFPLKKYKSSGSGACRPGFKSWLCPCLLM